MIVTELRLINIVLIIFLLTTTSSRNFIDAAASRCYLCSQKTLAECAGNIQENSPRFNAVLQYYTEPCNGQCILFRNEQTLTIRGCSWTYGHMTPKSTGWHELSPGIQAYFCDSYLCNNGTFERPEISKIQTEVINDELISVPSPTLSPQQLFIMSGSTLPVRQTETESPIIKEISRQLRQCYVCTARSSGCGEYLDPRYVSTFIQPCTSSCIIFRNPNDHHLITRDCSTSWPHIHAKSGLHKLLGSDAFFCQESLCNGISFDFIMGIFHNQLPAVITFPTTQIIEDISTTTMTPTTTMMIMNPTIPITTTSIPDFSSTTVNDEDVNVIWEDPDLDFVVVEPTTTTVSISNTSSPPFSSTEILDDTDDQYESSTIPPESIEHFDFIENIPASSTISGGMAIAEQDSQLNWWDINELPFPLLTIPINSLPTTTASTTSTVKLPNVDEDDWAIFNTSSILSNVPFEHLAGINTEGDFDMNDYFLLPTLTTTPIVDLINNQTLPFVPYYFTDYKAKDQLFGLMKPMPTLAMPPFSWMLQLANQNKSKSIIDRKNLINQKFTTKMTKKKKNRKRIKLQRILNDDVDQFYEYCYKKQCQHGGRLNSDCLCICLPAFSGHSCERIHCNQEPAHICDFVLEHECKSDPIRYLCPKFCRMNICSSNKSS